MSNRAGVVALPDPNKDRIAVIQDVIHKLEPEIARALPKAMNADRIARIALTLLRQSDNQAIKDGKPEQSLALCDPQSFAGALLTASALGLEPGINGEAYLVPYKRECTLIVGYQGLTKLFWQHPLALYLDAHAVRENDKFDYAYGLNQFLTHKPARGDRGPVVSYWAAGQLTNGASRFVVLSAEEVKSLRRGKVGPSGQIADPQLWMERKTPLRQLLKLMPKSVTLDAAMRVDEQRGSVLSRRAVPAAIAEQLPIPELPPVDAPEPEQGTRPVTGAEVRGATAPPSAAPRSAPAQEERGAARQPLLEIKPITGELANEVIGKLALCGLADKDAVLATIGAMVGHPVTATMNLTSIEGSRLVGTLDACIADPDGPVQSLAAHLVDLHRAAQETRP
jgi:recombination protein RecT